MIFKLTFILFSFCLFSQEDDSKVYEISSEEPDFKLLEKLDLYKDFPININKLNLFELSNLPGISLYLADKIISEINSKKLSWQEIKLKYKLNPLQAYVLENSLDFKSNINKSFHFRTRYYNQSEQNYGQLNNKFAGDNVSLYNRLGARFNNYNFNLLTNKDMGEQSYSDDFIANLSYANDNHKIILGDFRVNTGLGLLINSNFPIRRSSNPANTLSRFGDGFSPSRSILALGSFRGIAYQNNFIYNDINIISRLFYSNTARSGNLTENIFTSFYLTNLFRTETEIIKKNKIDETIYFANSEIKYKNIHLGVNYLKYNYPNELNIISQRFYNDKSGNNISFYSNLQLENSIFNYELAADSKYNISHLFIYNYSNTNIDFGISYKYLHPNARLQYNNLLTNYSANSNESGIFTYFTLKNNIYSNSLYMDIYNRPRLDKYADFPQSGIEIFDEFTYNINKNYFLLTRLRLRNYKDFSKSIPAYFDNQRLDFRGELRYSSNAFDGRFRADLVSTEFSENRRIGFGYLFFAELSKSFFTGNANSFRFTYYDTDSFEEAIWHYEYLLDGLLFAPSLFYQGFKVFIKSKFKIIEELALSFALTYDKGINFGTFGSGYDLINKNNVTRLYLQIDYGKR